MVLVTSLSRWTGCEILGKCEYLNPGGSVKDRVAKLMVEEATETSRGAEGAGGETSGRVMSISNNLENRNFDQKPASAWSDPHRPFGARVGTIYEGTSGSTGISLATMVKARGKGGQAYIVMPDDIGQDKVHLLHVLGATVEKVKPASIVDQGMYVNLARTRAQEHPGSTFANQFETWANFQAHYTSTGPEIFQQTRGNLDAFVAGAGTGGTIAGVASFLRDELEKTEPDHPLVVCLADPQGSGLFNVVNQGLMFDASEKEGGRRRHQVDSIVEGIGLNRLTRNLKAGLDEIDLAIKVTDAEMVAMSRHLIEQDGLFLGSSSAVNLVASVKLAKMSGRGKRIVTILCDSGSRHLTKLYNNEFIKTGGHDALLGLSFEEFLESL